MPPIKTSEMWYANCSGSLLEMAQTSLHWEVMCTVYTEACWVFTDTSSDLTLLHLSLYNLSLVHFCRPSRLRRHCHHNALQTRLKGNSTITSSYNHFVLYDTITYCSSDKMILWWVFRFKIFIFKDCLRKHQVGTISPKQKPTSTSLLCFRGDSGSLPLHIKAMSVMSSAPDRNGDSNLKIHNKVK